ncbi:glutamate racemase [Dendrosporobacter sp. 1207_IL3150]|uniref:glutamate racemase n=1 Tax=Dendrosporobacter sp. 1207_IL3150 TaxID=3084054 RepID=UPI002FD95436
MSNNAPIGIFDSGIGGLTVVKEIRKIMPQENLIYFGDTARAPYGSRSPAQIIEFMHQILKFFSEQNVKMAIFACNTMTALGLNQAKEKYPFQLIGMSTGVEQALSRSVNKNIGVIATQATIASGSHGNDIKNTAPKARIFPQACPKFVPLIENEVINGAEISESVCEYLTPMKDVGVDTLILGCTHYPFINESIRSIVGPDVNIVNPASDTAAAAYNVLVRKGQLADDKQQGRVRLCFSAGVDKAKRMADLVMDTTNVEFELVNLEV